MSLGVNSMSLFLSIIFMINIPQIILIRKYPEFLDNTCDSLSLANSMLIFPAFK
jgi:hypothetical protein